MICFLVNLLSGHLFAKLLICGYFYYKPHIASLFKVIYFSKKKKKKKNNNNNKASLRTFELYSRSAKTLWPSVPN